MCMCVCMHIHMYIYIFVGIETKMYKGMGGCNDCYKKVNCGMRGLKNDAHRWVA